MKNEYDFTNAKRGAIIQAPNKQRITIRLDVDIIDWFKGQVQGGGNYQTLINEALRNHLDHIDGQLENTIRKVIREEIKAVNMA